ncbi:iron-containing alcohol dehydrogenase [Domibacillus sp. DTU_2020_1001157_1_SI_ALB_TIR_016]|uniref:iron-containing alcohol dehydrogenase n=1 Tax=Domibacillus sp. DTU_2020_1001157_1_SI_ALB_TIR_016 TaxID=3077789 RepID=UPI0028E4A5E7|nr:iron-containing alcohol dehydrogenase [Domibacillus sp. DTU_2020_1001157_1_SI_ALB_TIR_016]WNS79597.1 iron-containing alcohol dehydrogenase [Domibacillus sp. DTU_2020_1001157_1_SI_ALB_TIR_016]
MSAKSFAYYMPTRIESGSGISKKTGEFIRELGISNVLIVTDKGVRTANLLEEVEKSLLDANVQYEIYDEIEPNPSAETIENGTEFLQQHKSEAVLAVGGGSSIDTAKGIAVMAVNPGNIIDYEGVGKIQNPPLPIIAIPTTAGTGSEVTPSTVVTNRETSFKLAVISPNLYPRLAILDPILTLNLPQGITAATGMDALTHAIESYTSKTANPISQAFAIQAVKMIGENLTKTYFVGTDLESRENMLVASMLAGAAFAQSRLGNVHAISHTFGGVFNVPHGIANAALLPFVMRYNLPACAEQYKDIAAALGADVIGLTAVQAAEKAIEEVIQMNQSMNIPLNIQELGVSLDALPKLVEDSMRSGNVLVNPRLTRAEDIQSIIENAYNGTLH